MTVSPAVSDGYDDKPGADLMKFRPCGDALEVLAERFTDPPHDLAASAEDWAKSLAVQAIVWGYILGFDAAHDGLWRGEETTLERLKTACANDPTKSALRHLEALTH